MTKRKTWKQKIGKKMLSHIAETTQRCTLAEFKANIEEQRKNPSNCCFECLLIAQKLGL